MGLFRTAARASVAASVVGNVQRRQQLRWAAQDQQRAAAAPAAPAASAPAPGPSVIEQLQQLGQLRDSGVLTEAEFETQKQRVLAGG